MGFGVWHDAERQLSAGWSAWDWLQHARRLVIQLSASPRSPFKDGLQYNSADLYVASLDPGIRPSPGQINAPPTFLDPSGARPGRINQWNIAIQREFFNDLSVEVAYVGNRAVWLQADGMLDLNALTEDRLTGFGLNVNNAADRTLLTSAMSSPQVQARGFQLPYHGFPANLTLAQALRPYPQFSSIGTRWAARGNTWYDSLQVKVTKRYSHGLTMTGGFTWQKELVLGALSGLAHSPIASGRQRYLQSPTEQVHLRGLSASAVRRRLHLSNTGVH